MTAFSQYLIFGRSGVYFAPIKPAPCTYGTPRHGVTPIFRSDLLSGGSHIVGQLARDMPNRDFPETTCLGLPEANYYDYIVGRLTTNSGNALALSLRIQLDSSVVDLSMGRPGLGALRLSRLCLTG